MEWNALNPIEWYFLILSVICLIGAGSILEISWKNKKEAEYWKRQCRRMKRRETQLQEN